MNRDGIEKGKKILIGLCIFFVVIIIFGSCSSRQIAEEKSPKIVEANGKKTDLLSLKTYEDVKNAYEENSEKIMNREKVQELNITNLDDVLKYANRVNDIISTINNTNDKIYTIKKLVDIDDLMNNTSEDIMNETLIYLIKEYEQGGFENNPAVNLYLAMYLDLKLDNYKDMKEVDTIIIDMIQVLKDTIRINNDTFNEDIRNNMKKDIETNKMQIKDNIETIKTHIK